MKLLVVLGYSDGRADGLHPICAARLERAAEVADGADVVVLTGWARRLGGVSEAELMRRAWAGPAGPVVCETEARITAENAVEVARLAGELGARDVVVVTSWWHRPRASLLFRLLGPTGARVRVVPAARPWSLRLLVREFACFALVPGQVRRARTRGTPADVLSPSDDV